MSREFEIELLERVARGELTPEQAWATLAGERVLDAAAAVDGVHIDHARTGRCGFPEVVLCAGKQPAEAAAAARAVLDRAPRVLLTRADAAHADAVRAAVPDAEWRERARCLLVDREPRAPVGLVAVVAAGTSDLPVAEEALATLDAMGCRTTLHADVGVAGLHRLLAALPAIRRAHVSLAVAGMEGTLPTVLAGLVDHPVLGVPTSVGYGTGVAGLSALATMLNSCAAGLGVVNIDNGFGAACLAARINRAITDAATSEPAARSQTFETQ